MEDILINRLPKSIVNVFALVAKLSLYQVLRPTLYTIYEI